jgi:hypothetical protein
MCFLEYMWTKYDNVLFVSDICKNILLITLIGNVTTTSKGDQYWKAQRYTILTKIVDETTQACFL